MSFFNAGFFLWVIYIYFFKNYAIYRGMKNRKLYLRSRIQHMALIKSISGIRGTIGGTPGKSLTPIDVVKFTTAYGAWVGTQGDNKKIVIGRDGRISGQMVRD